MLNIVIDKIKKARNPVDYWKKRGMKIGVNCEIYSSAKFGSEPYLITIGDHVRINDQVQFVTHDGVGYGHYVG